jgi:limonene-1,2-epoxide hydrolase
VRDGRITLWRDYFDFFDFIKATVRGLAGIAIPSLRRSL